MKLWMLLLPAVLLSSQACKSDKKKSNPPPSAPTNAGEQTDDDSVTDVLIGQEMLALIDAKCVSCHNAEKKEGGLDFTNRTVVGDRAEDIVAAILDGTMPKDQNLSAEEKQLAEAWRDDNFSLPKNDESGPDKDGDQPNDDNNDEDGPSKGDDGDKPEQNEEGPSKKDPSQNDDEDCFENKKKMFCDWVGKYDRLKEKYADYCAE